MTHPPSRLLTRLDAAIAQAGDSADGDCLRAERAIYLARLGEAAEAKGVVDDLKGARQRRLSFSVSGWTSLADAMVEYFGDASFAARDKLLRAQALAASAGLSQLSALSSAWLAQLDFSALRLREMDKNLRRALSTAPEYRPARIRSDLVLAQAHHFARKLDIALAFYESARRNAVEEGDELSTGAVIYNMAWHRLLELRQSVLRDGEEGEERLTFLSEQSMRSHDEFLGVSSFGELHAMFRAEALSLTGRPEEAIELYRDGLESLKLGGVGRWRGHFLADYAWCKARVGDSLGAAQTAAASIEAMDDQLQLDDLAAAHSSLALLYGVLGDSSRASFHQGHAAATWQEIEQLQSEVVALLVDLRPS
jgi:hypothetical protein